MYNQDLVDKLYPGASIYEAMEIWTLPKHKKNQLETICKEKKYFAQLKKDGNWYEYSKSQSGVSYLFSRGVSTKTGLPVESIKNVPHIEQIFSKIPNDTVLIGEIYFPGKTTDAVRGIMGCLPKKAVDRQKADGYISFYLHDILKFEGRDVTQLGALDRYNLLVEVYDTFIAKNSYITVADIIEDDIYNFVGLALENGEEGAVLKLKTAPYSEGKRPAWSMIKVKKQDNVDVVCLGFDNPTMEYTGTELENWEFWGVFEKSDLYDDGWALTQRLHGPKPPVIRSPNFKTIPLTKAFYYGWKTSMRLGLYKEDKLIQIGTVSSGLNDTLKEDFAKNPEKYISRVVECQCMELNNEALRHPIFLRFRDDKKAESCTFKSIFNS